MYSEITCGAFESLPGLIVDFNNLTIPCIDYVNIKLFKITNSSQGFFIRVPCSEVGEQVYDLKVSAFNSSFEDSISKFQPVKRSNSEQFMLINYIDNVALDEKSAFFPNIQALYTLNVKVLKAEDIPASVFNGNYLNSKCGARSYSPNLNAI